MKKTDPVCGMEFEANANSAQSDFGGETFYFCSEKCKGTFELAPQDYIVNGGSYKEHADHADHGHCC